MDDLIETQLYLTAPPMSHTNAAAALAAVLESGPVACVRARIEGEDDADGLAGLRDVCHAREVPLVLQAPESVLFARAVKYSLDGVQVSAAPKTIAYARKTLGKDAIVGTFAGTSRHDAMTAAETGADYVAFGPLADVDVDLIEWWAQVIETPQVVEGAATPADAASLAGIADFITISSALWEQEDPVAAVGEWRSAIEGKHVPRT